MAITEQQITAAAEQLTDTIALKLADLADELLGRPAIGSNEWLTQDQHMRENPSERAASLREWHLTKLAIVRKAGASPVGDVINAREAGASWQAIAGIYGVSRQAAYDRWAKYCTND